jgi:predicted hotdog family 3-hydroxylacyl-ACP dehydratase
MVDRLVAVADGRYTTEFRILPGNFFLKDGVLQEYALIENLAQSCVAAIGYDNRDDYPLPIQGFIGGISRLTVYELPRVGALLRTDLVKCQQLGNLYLMAGEIRVGDRLHFACELKLAGSSSTV